METNYYVYVHRNKENNEIFYVGIGKNNRAWNKGGRNNFWNNYVKKHDYYVEIVFEYLTRKKAASLEIELIKKYGRRCKNEGNLVNICDGGEGNIGYTHTETWKLNFSKKVKGKKKKPLSKEAKEKISNKLKGRNINNGHKIIQYDLSGNIINSYLSVNQAVKETNIKAIDMHLTNPEKYRTVGGFIWMYKDKPNNYSLEERIKLANSRKKLPDSHSKLISEKIKKNIIQCDKNNNLIQEWSSIKEARIKLNINSISNCLSGKQKTAGGYIWKYKE